MNKTTIAVTVLFIGVGFGLLLYYSFGFRVTASAAYLLLSGFTLGHIVRRNAPTRLFVVLSIQASLLVTASACAYLLEAGRYALLRSENLVMFALEFPVVVLLLFLGSRMSKFLPHQHGKESNQPVQTRPTSRPV